MKKGFAVKGLRCLDLDNLEGKVVTFGCFQYQGGNNARGSHHISVTDKPFCRASYTGQSIHCYISNSKFMSRKSIEEFLIDKRERIFVAVNLREAKQAEKILDKIKIDYAINIEPYYRISPFQTAHQGAAFYVKSEDAAFSRKTLKEKGLGIGVVHI